MAKRSARRARVQDPEQRPRAAEPAPPAAPPKKRGFWMGALASAAILVPLAVIATLLLSGGDAESAESAQNPAATPGATPSADEQEAAAEIRRESAVRDKEQIKELTDRARAMSEDFAPVVAGLGKTLPPGKDEPGPIASPADVEEWRRTVREADDYFAETVSGETATNVARNGLANAVDVLSEALETYRIALEEPEARESLLRRAAAQRDLAASTWSTAAIQVDVINIDAGYGHQHVTFPSAGGENAMPPDSLPEGTDATEP